MWAPKFANDDDIRHKKCNNQNKPYSTPTEKYN